MKNRNGWIKIVEAFTSILLIAGILILIIGNLNFRTDDVSQGVYDSQYAILREIQLNSLLRNEILNVPNVNLPLEWADFDELPNVKGKITDRTPGYLTCEAKLCASGEECVSDLTPPGEDVFVRGAMISANSSNYSPRKLNLFCWEKGNFE
ncbi:MAG TPA: hypothetical protein VJ208_00505 [Candidatus Nanoarchaeia archaeon]|nr:hypothetical protein [Candidatus Nanoarchaeia archaeon]